MAPEIADSDAESDIIVQNDSVQQELYSPPATRPTGTVRDNATQRLSNLDSSAKRGTGSTDRLIHDLYKPSYDGAGDEEQQSGDLFAMSGNANKRRRAQSDVQHISETAAEEPAKKRARTYGSKARDADVDFFGTGPPQMDQQIPEPRREQEDAPGPGSQSPPQFGSSPSRIGQRERDRPRRVVSLINAPQRVTTSTSSMGGYQSIELDFRGGIDVNTNPFGSLSQISADNFAPQDQEPTASNELNGLISHFAAQDQEPTASNELNGLISHFADPDIQTQMMNSPVHQNTPSRPTVEPLSEAEDDSNVLHFDDDDDEPFDVGKPSSKRRKTDAPLVTSAGIPSQPRRAVSIASESMAKSSKKSQTSKRGPPESKNQKEDVASGLADEPATTTIGPPALDEHQHTSRSRVDTMDISSQTSQSSQPASNTKKKRKQTKTDPILAEEPKKHPSSELGLNDESVIGLPKEQYNPRPSRSRSKRLIDQDEPGVGLEIPSKRVQEPVATPAQASATSKPSTGKSRKSKVKRAKTSAAALLKPSAPMLSEGEDDVVWMDIKPASVKLNLPPDVAALKKEEPEDKEELSEDELQRNESPDRLGKGKVVSVEIPLSKDQGEAQSDGASDNKPKKKRGRPKKGGKEKEVASPAAKIGEQLETFPRKDSSNEARQALASKDPNTSKAQPKSKAKSKAIITDSDDEDEGVDAPQAPEKEAVAVPTSSKPTPTADKENTLPIPLPSAASPTTKPTTNTSTPEKKPTHSPLKATPLSATSSLTRHRIGLSRRTKIPSLLRKVDRHKPPPTKTGVKVKELKIKGVNDGGEVNRDGADGGEGGEGGGKWTGVLRDKDGRLVEWDF